MLPNKILPLTIFMVLAFTSCIKRFEPDIEGKDAVKYVVTGQITKGDSIHFINVSSTAPLSDPWYKYFLPVNGCRVIVIDDMGNMFLATESGDWDGNYWVYIPDGSIQTGHSFRVEILLHGGDQIVSDFDEVQDCPEMDSVYYLLETLPSVNPYLTIKGIRFYLDLSAQNSGCRNFRWEAFETYEYKAILAKETSRKVCWMTGMIKNIFTQTTRNLAENKYMHYPLHFVDNYSSQRLKYGYSLLIRQYALSEDAFEFWDKVRINNSEQGGLYEKQPLAIKGNLRNLTHPEMQVLGFFGASSVKEKRIFVKNIENLPIEYLDCEPDPRPEASCVDCLSVGGTNIKPNFWPN
ncbi:MAG: DUF4249 domain-containing protein [Bacteroidales bacterium]